MDFKKEITTIKDDVQSIKSLLEIDSETEEVTPNGKTIIQAKVKYVDTRIQRAFYYDKKLIKVFDKHYPASTYNKSLIMNELLRKFLDENKLI